MIQYLADILQAAGVPLLPSSSTVLPNDPNEDETARRIQTTMEVWIGLRQIDTEDDFAILTVEDCGPLSDAVMAATVRWLVASWNEELNNRGSRWTTDATDTTTASMTSPPPTTTTTTSPTKPLLVFHHTNGNTIRTTLLHVIATLPHEPLPTTTTTTGTPKSLGRQHHHHHHHHPSILEAAVTSVRATTYLRTWMMMMMELDVIDPYSTTPTTLSITASTICNDPLSSSSSSSLSRRLLSFLEPITDDNNRTISSTVTTTATTATTTAQTISSSSSSILLIQAFFHHLLNLPFLQQQIVSLTHHLQQQPSGPHSDDPHTIMTTSLSSTQVTKRLQQYEYVQSILQQIQNEFQQHLDDLEYILGDFYAAAAPPVRCYIRQQLGQLWTNFIRNESVVSSGISSSSYTNASVKQENTKAVAIRLTLNVLRRILLGMSRSSTAPAATSVTDHSSQQHDASSTMESVRDHLLFQQLIPLHEVNGVVLWRDQVSILELYHEPLCQCIAILIQQELLKTDNKTTIVFQVIQQLLQRPNIFPNVGSTSKQVLLLHEIDTYLRLLPSSRTNGTLDNDTYRREESAMLQLLLKLLGRCMSSEHSRVAERALQFFQSSLMDVFVMKQSTPDPDDPQQRHQSSNRRTCLRILLPSLIRTEPSWNPTVRKMTFHVVKKLQMLDDEMFVAMCNELFLHHQMRVAEAPTIDKPTTSKLFTQSNETEITSIPDLSLKAGMGNWKPPSSTLSLPSIPGRGVAPWSKSNGVQASSHPNHPRQPAGIKSTVAPQLTITGVAPWAVPTQTKQTLPIRNANIRPSQEPLPPNDQSNTTPKSGYHHVLAYMEKIKPPVEEEGVSSWSQSQMAETPTLLPNLKFHDLVFGHELGSGAFGSVKYARLIDKTKSRSYWPEYAVKVVSTNKIYEMGYEISIQREIAVLHLLSHPGIARLVSSFRFNDGAYLVLEYASRGDLHSLLLKHGSLDVESTRFVIGEVVATLSSIHDLGFVYGDLKPENIVITEPGHIKLTDFGGCRPFTKEAKQLLSTVSKDILKNLRNGDWKDTAQSQSTFDDQENDNEDTEQENCETENNKKDEWVEDFRVEGTTAYLPPEVVMGGVPTFAADAWALGCVTYQCLTGRPPLIEANDEATRNRIVRFDIGKDQAYNDVDQLFIDKHATGVNSEARDFIKRLLDRDPLQRPSMNQVADHEFFPSNVFALHSQAAYPLDVGSVGPTPNAQWARRQFSSIWAPQPEAYNIVISTNLSTNNSTRTKPLAEQPIIEGDEASGYFSTFGKVSHVEKASTAGKRNRKIMLPPSYE